MTTATGDARAAPKSNFWASGHWPTLVAALLYFDLAFMVWVILGPLAPAIAEDLGLSPAQTGLMVAVPTLAGAVLRVAGGLFVDRIGPTTASILEAAERGGVTPLAAAQEAALERLGRQPAVA